VEILFSNQSLTILKFLEPLNHCGCSKVQLLGQYSKNRSQDKMSTYQMSWISIKDIFKLVPHFGLKMTKVDKKW
jgi:hypothetical protein